MPGDGHLCVGVHCVNRSRRRTQSAFPMWHTSSLVEWGLGVVGFSSCVSIQSLAIHCSSGFACLLSADYHSVKPSHRLPNCHRLNDAHLDILIKAGFYSVLPVECYWYRGVVSHRLGIWVDHQTHRWTCHNGEGLVNATVEGTGCVKFQQVALQGLPVFFDGRHRQ